jgi:hypothetical protein
MATGNRGADMTAVVSAEHAARTWLTGATGLLIVAAAFVMMAWAAPMHSPARSPQPAPPHSVTVSQVTVSQLESQVRPGAPELDSAGRTPSAARR